MHNLRKSGWRLSALVAVMAACAPLSHAGAQEPALAALDALSPGAWNIRYRPDNTTQRICLRDGRQFIQLRHTANGCTRFVIEDTPDRVTVQYTCTGHGYGRTHIRRESRGLVQINSQGIVDGLPFQFSAEARRVGPCDG